MAERANTNPYTVEELLGEEFIRDKRLVLGSTDSAHAVAFGEFRGESVVAKPFYGKAALHRAQKELQLEKFVGKNGIKTVNPLEVISPRQERAAVLISELIPGLKGMNVLSLGEDPSTPYGAALTEPIRSVVETLGQIHALRVTHGDPQIKNFGFTEREAADGLIKLKPYVYDFESGSMHGDNKKGSEYLENSAKKDVRILSKSLGARQFGGQDDDVANDTLREVVLGSYMSSPGMEVMGPAEATKTVDESLRAFQASRLNSIKYMGHLAVD